MKTSKISKADKTKHKEKYMNIGWNIINLKGQSNYGTCATSGR